MALELWLTFVLAAGIILVIPGPTIILVISQAVAHGRKSVAPLVGGVLLGDFTAMTLSLLGLGAVLAASAAVFSLLKWVGALYLIFLGVKLWRTHPENGAAAAAVAAASTSALFRRSYIVTALNPKSIAFFVAFLPQFVDPGRAAFTQLAILGATFLTLAGVNAALYGLFAGQLRETIRKPLVQRWFNRCGATALIGAGIFTAGMQRSA